MPLFEMTDSDLVAVPTTSFAAEQILERADLQRLIRARIDILVPDVLIVSEEFGAFTESRRRIDLLGVDHDGHLIVFELKRTEDGGHLELQALRYAAMVSTMTFDDLVGHFEAYLQKVNPMAADAARDQLASWLEDVGGSEAEISREVRIVLVTAGFDREITTTVLWLNDIYQMDICCIRLHPYKLDDRVLLDVEQVIPLPEAEDLMIQLRKREAKAREARTSGVDRTRYVVISPEGRTEPLPKRRAILSMVEAVAATKVGLASIAGVLSPTKVMQVPGVRTGEDLYEALVEKYPALPQNRFRWFLEQPLTDGRDTWVVSNQWGTETEHVLQALVSLAPGQGLGFEPVAPGAKTEA